MTTNEKHSQSYEVDDSTADVSKNEKNKEEDGDFQYPSAGKLWLVMLSLYIALFLVALVRPYSFNPFRSPRHYPFPFMSLIFPRTKPSSQLPYPV